ncbi:hypothetical protein BDD12DRAFT_916981 [Trichophaea hybrida]|nr:hypothetical protein BDD12DRAFT_916981 [Trichophaea hybrida]
MAALSYIWGEPQPTTTTKNIESYVKDGFKDSTDDKNQQLEQIRRIYRDAYVTIIASCASKVSQGFLEDQPVRVPVARIPFRCLDHSPSTGRHYDELEPVNYRGWCLLYASYIVQYYCQKETVAIGSGLCEPTTGMRLPTMIIPSGQPPSSTNANQVARQAWCIREPSDKLVALAGVAEEFHRVWKTKYLAGLWQHTLLQDLLWYNSYQYLPRPEKYRVPSWS